MKRFFCILSLILSVTGSIKAADSTFFDYQNFNHGYCPECNCYPCCCKARGADCTTCTPPAAACNGDAPYDPNAAPCAPTPCAPCANGNGDCSPCEKPDPCQPAVVCGTQCGISPWVLGIVIATVAAAAAIIISTNNGHSHS